jgi:flagellar basal body-associated protein FliL
MRKLIITAIAVIAMTAAIGGSVAFALHGQSPAAAERAMMLQNLSEHSRTVPLWIPG